MGFNSLRQPCGLPPPSRRKALTGFAAQGFPSEGGMGEFAGRRLPSWFPPRGAVTTPTSASFNIGAWFPPRGAVTAPTSASFNIGAWPPPRGGCQPKADWGSEGAGVSAPEGVQYNPTRRREEPKDSSHPLRMTTMPGCHPERSEGSFSFLFENSIRNISSGSLTRFETARLFHTTKAASH